MQRYTIFISRQKKKPENERSGLYFRWKIDIINFFSAHYYTLCAQNYHIPDLKTYILPCFVSKS